ncbi:DUF4412 domain-containing protein [Salinisphaera aquimarina]|uniref:DUF4412 domain-containing protein n=1 Tax=Salinisphaera aquimarina TaxID=2094031 RepID=A0ABV7EMU4_9GAMM
MNRIALHAAALALVLGFASAAQAASDDTTLVYQGANGRFTVDIRPGEVRIDDASDQWQLYEQNEATIFSVNPADRTYTRLDKSVAGNIRSRVDSLRAQVENKVQQLPENQRATARAALIQSMPALDSSEHKVGLDRTGQTDTVAGVNCSVVQVVRDGKPAESLCVASAEDLDISEKSFDSVQAMFTLMQTMLAGTGFEAAGLPYLSLSGMPLRFTDTNTGEKRQLTRISHDTIPESHFTIPDSYIETSITIDGG